MKKIVITGGAGFIGSHLAKKLIEKGFEVHIVDNLSNGKKENIPENAKVHICDIRETAKLERIFKNASIIFHLAALPNVEYSIHNPNETHDINTNGTYSVLLAAEKNKVKKIIYASSSAVYGDQKSPKLKENLIPKPKSPYALQKYIGELHMKMWSELYKVNTLSLRFFNVYGPRQRENGAYVFVIAKFLKCKRENKPMPITGDGSSRRDFIYIEDVVDACINCINKKTTPGDIINIGAGEDYSINDIANIIGGKKIYIKSRVEPKKTLADISKAKKLLNWTPNISLKKGIERIIKN